MNIRVLLACALLACGRAHAQEPSAPPVHPSNGVIELGARPLLPFDTRPIGMRTEAYLPWRGRVKITVRNVSFATATVVDRGTSDFDYEVLDSDGQMVERTDLGTRLAAVPRGGALVSPTLSVIHLAPLREISSEVDLSNYFRILPAHAYKVTIRRSQGLPATDEFGKSLKEVEVSCSFEVSERGLPRDTPHR